MRIKIKQLAAIFVMTMLILASTFSVVKAVTPQTKACGTCTYTLDANGNLTIAPTSGNEGTLASITSSGTNPIKDFRNDIKTVKFRGTVHAGTKLNTLFMDCVNLKSVDLTGFDTSNTTDFKNIFRGCTKLETITGLNNLDVRKATDMTNMFHYCHSLTSIDISNWNTVNPDTLTSGLEIVSGMFYRCINLENIKFGENFNTTNVTNFANMFGDCRKLKSLDLSMFDTANAEKMRGMFQNCYELESLNIENFTTSKVKDMYLMFRNLYKLDLVDVSNFDTSSLEGGAERQASIFENDKRIKFGANSIFSLANNGEGCFSRGTWLREEDNELFSVNDLYDAMAAGTQAGTYRNISKMSDEIQIKYSVDYKVDALSNIDSFTCSNSAFEKIGNEVFLHLNDNVEDQTVNDCFDLLFEDVVTDKDGNKYNLKFKMKKIVFTKIPDVATQGQTDPVYFSILDLASGLRLRNVMYSTEENRDNDISIAFANGSTTKYDFEIQIVDDNDNPQDGSYIFSTYDIDIPAKNDEGVEVYNDDSEGLNLKSGFNFDNLQHADTTFLDISDITGGGKRITGTRRDSESELSDFAVEADASGIDATWTSGLSASSLLLSYYQPKVVEFEKVDDRDEVVENVDFELYYGSETTALDTWTTEATTNKKLFLNPGQYTLKETSTPDAYNALADQTFFVDINDQITYNEQTQTDSLLKIVNTRKDTSVLVHHYLLDRDGNPTTIKVPSITDGEVIEDELIEGKVYDEYQTNYATNINNNYEVAVVPDNYRGYMDVNQIVLTYYYKLKDAEVITHHYVLDRDGNETTECVPLNVEGTVAQDVTQAKKFGDNYQTLALTNIDEKYELAITPANAEGTVDASSIEVTYYYRLKDYGYKVKYYYDGVIDNSKTESGNAQYGSSISNYTDKNIVGYKFDKTENLPLTISNNVNSNEIRVYYVRDTYGYTVEYYYDNVKDDSKTERLSGTFGSEINTYPDKCIDGYRLNNVDSLPMVITEDTSNNVIKVYYVKRNDLSYVVNYLEKGTNNVIKVQKYADDVTYGDIINSADEVVSIYGYNYDSADKESITIAVASNNVINLYYTKKAATVLVHHYIENTTNKVPSTTEGETVEDVTLNGLVGNEYTTSSASNVSNKYELVSATPENYTGNYTESEIVVTYYYRLKDASVVAHYYIEGTTTKVPSNVEGERVQDITQTGKVDDEYQTSVASNVSSIYELVAVPENATGTMKVEPTDVYYYYRLKNYGYTVEYYYDDVKDDNKTEAGTEKYGNQITDYTDKNITGYKLDKTENLPLTISDNVSENIIKVYYVKDNFNYTVEYYYDNVKDNTKTYTNSAEFGSEISTYPDGSKDGYKFDRDEGKPLTITENAENNIIKVYYVTRADLSYIVNYLDKNTNEAIERQKYEENVSFGQEITSENEVIPIYGYDYDSADKETLTISTTAANNVINLYYTKKAATVLVHHYIENTTNKVPSTTEGEAVEDVTLDGLVGEEYTTTEAQNVSNKYELVSATPENYTGEFTEAQKEVTYYYRLKDAEVIVHHYIENTTTKVPSNVEGEEVSDVTMNGKVDDEYHTSAATNINENYELVGVPRNAEGTMSVDQTVVTYYYALKNAKAVARYVDLYAEIVEPDDTDEIAERQTKTGKIGDEYETNQKEIEGYTFIRSTNNTEGTLTLEDIDVVYYYAPNTYVTVRYLEKGSNEVLSPEVTKEGFAGKEFETEEETIDNYTLVEVDGPVSGTMTKAPITTTYYYLQNTKARVEYIDKADNHVMEWREQTGLVGDEFVTEAKEFENYILVESPEQTTINMAKDMITLRYYYVYNNASLIVRYINVLTGAVIESEIETGKTVGDEYHKIVKDIPGYEVVVELNGHDYTPTNADGYYSNDPITVDFYYIRKASVTAKYVDKATGEELTEDVVINGYENDPYQTEEKTFAGYVLDSVDGNTNSIMNITTDDEGNVVTNKVVIYYYKKASTIIVNHIDVNTDEILSVERKSGFEGDNYSTTSKKIKSYDLVEDRLPENKDGKYARDEQVVNYYYIKKLTVVVEYLDKITGARLAIEDKIEGHEGDTYTTTPKELLGYEVVGVPKNAAGEMKVEEKEDGTFENEIKVTYYYKIPCRVVVEYIDKETGKKLTTSTAIEGYENDEYETKAKEFAGYELIQEPENAKGIMKVQLNENKETTEIVVRYYYAKKATGTLPQTGEEVVKNILYVVAIITNVSLAIAAYRVIKKEKHN